MFLKTKQIKKEYVRPSKLGKQHSYSRKKTIAEFRCDNCNSVFEREIGKLDHRRLSNSYFHVCSNCDTKRFAQRKGVERKRVWDLPVDSDIDISKI
jgi:hypothetical protein